jgi:hypothetical protein
MKTHISGPFLSFLRHATPHDRWCVFERTVVPNTAKYSGVIFPPILLELPLTPILAILGM